MFQLEGVQEVAFTNVNVRRELHGEDNVRAIDIAHTMTGENTLLDLIEPGLRELHYCNHALKAGQEPLPDMLVPLPNLRHPRLPTRLTWGKGERWRGYRWTLDYGLQEAAVDLTDCVLANVWYELMEGGSVTIGFTIQFNGDELGDDNLLGRLAGLASVGGGHVSLLAPPELKAVKKGWRSGKPDAVRTGPDTHEAQLGLDEDDEAGDEGVQGAFEDTDLDPATPEGAFAAANRVH